MAKISNPDRNDEMKVIVENGREEIDVDRF